MLKTNQYQLPFLYQTNSSEPLDQSVPKGCQQSDLLKNHHHPNLYINTEHHPSLHRADSFKPNNYINHHKFQNGNVESIQENQYEYSDSDEEEEEVDLKNEEDENDYCYGGYHPVEINEILNQNYQIIRKLGWGHFSTVWLAYDKRSDNHVAIKIVRSQSHYTQAALDEIKILEIINNKNPNHPGYQHLIKLNDWFYHNGPNGKHVCMVFEVLGENMLGLINKFSIEKNKEVSIKLSNLEKTYGGLPISITKQISKQILLALDYLHRECGLIHTDIKPENVLLEIKNVEQFVKLLKIDQSEKRKKNSHSHRKSSSCSINSPIKCSKPLPSPLTTSSNFDLHDYFNSYSKNQSNSSKNEEGSSANTSTSAGGSIQCYDELDDNESPVFSTHQNQSSSGATSSNLTSYVICASETNSDDEEEDEDEDQSHESRKDNNNYTYHEAISSRFSSISLEDSPILSPSQSSNTTQQELASIITVKLADLGNACFTNLHFTNDIQTRQYRAPEILLGHKWGCSTDIWSTACLIFELITGDYLFDPKNGKNYTKDDDHIAQVLELIDDKDVSYQFMYDCKYATEFFHSDFKTLRRIKNLKYWDLKNVLVQKYKMNENCAQEIDDFLTPMLKIDPKFRVDAGGWSNHDWLDDVKNCGFINRPCGCKGEDIKGWDKRCKD